MGRLTEVQEYKNDGEKTAPVSLRALLRDIRRCWKHIAPNNGVEKYRIVKNFSKVYHSQFSEILNKYSFKKNNEAQNSYTIDQLNRKIDRVENRVIGANALSYVDLRCYANAVNVPTGLLLLYSHMCGDEYRDKRLEQRDTTQAQEKLLAFLDFNIECMNITKIEILKNINAVSSPYFFEELEEIDLSSRYIVNLDLLETWSELYAEYKKKYPDDN